jgi:hypothetical protein
MVSTRNLHPFRCFPMPSLKLTLGLIWIALAMSATVAAQTIPTGPYGFIINATFSDPSTQGGTAVLGLMNFNGKGTVSGPYTLEMGSGGSGPQENISGTFTGTYSSNPEGRGTISIALENMDLTISMVTENHGLQLVVTDCVGSFCNLGGSVMSGIGVAEFVGSSVTATKQSLNGSYGLQSTKDAPGPLTSVGVWTFDGVGNVSTAETVVTPGPTVQSGTSLGTYTVNSNGTGTITIPSQAGQPMGKTFAFVITNYPSELLVLQTNRPGDGVLYSIGQLQTTAQATVSPIALNYAAQSVGTTSPAKIVTLKNNLSTALTVKTFTFTGTDPSDFAVSAHSCTASLAANSSCTISVVFKPKATGTRTATLNVNDSANNSPQTISLTGTGD